MLLTTINIIIVIIISFVLHMYTRYSCETDELTEGNTDNKTL